MPDTDTNRRSRGWFIQRSYDYDIHDKDGQITSNITRDQWRRQVMTEWQSNITSKDWLLMIYHDKDKLTNTDGTTKLKPFHVHGLVRFANAKTQSAVIKAMRLSRSENCQAVKSYTDSARYLIHVSESALNAQKHIYDKSEVIELNKTITDAISRSAKSGKKRLNDREITDYIDELSVNIAKSKITMYRARNKLKNDFGESRGHALWIRYADRFNKDLQLALSDRARTAKQTTRDLKTIYIYGDGGVGKSQLARAMARQLSTDDGNYHAVAAPDKSKTFDLASGYQGENVTILDDCKGSVFDMRAFFNIFDPFQYSMINSRNFDKDWLADYAMVTCSDTLPTWVNTLMGIDDAMAWRGPHNADLIRNGWQVLRRLPIVIHVSAGDKSHAAVAQIYALSETLHMHVGIGVLNCDDVTDRDLLDTWTKSVLACIHNNCVIQYTSDPTIDDLLIPDSNCLMLRTLATSKGKKYADDVEKYCQTH